MNKRPVSKLPGITAWALAPAILSLESVKEFNHGEHGETRSFDTKIIFFSVKLRGLFLKLRITALALALIAMASCTQKNSAEYFTVEIFTAETDTIPEYVLDSGGEWLIFRTSRQLKDISFISVGFGDDNNFYQDDILLPLNNLPIFIIRSYVSETIPNRGISFTDENGSRRFFYIMQSNMDGSVSLMEFKNKPLPPQQLIYIVEFNNQRVPITVYYSHGDGVEYYYIDSLTFEYDGKKHSISLDDVSEKFPFEDPDDFGLIDVTTDYNFDNYMDIAILSGRGAYHSWSDIFIYNPKEKKYYYQAELSKEPDVWIDTETQTVKVHGKSGHAGMIYSFSEYKWENGQLTLIYHENQDYDDDLELYIRKTCILQNGEWIHRSALIGEDGELSYIPQD